MPDSCPCPQEILCLMVKHTRNLCVWCIISALRDMQVRCRPRAERTASAEVAANNWEGKRQSLLLVPQYFAGYAAAKSLQSCPTLCHPIDGSPPGSPVPGILQERTLEWVAISSSNAWKWKVKVKSLSHVRLSTTPWTAAYQAPPSMGFSRQKYWSGVPLPSPFAGYMTTLNSDCISQICFAANAAMWQLHGA